MITINKTLYIVQDKTYINCEHDSFVVSVDGKEKTRIPVTVIQQIIICANTTVSSYFIGYCNEHKIVVAYVSPQGDYYGRFCGKSVGNVLLRQGQYRLYDDNTKRVELVKSFVLGKASNQIHRLVKSAEQSNHNDGEALFKAAEQIADILAKLKSAKDVESIRGMEGSISSIYFGAFDLMLSTKDESMKFIERSRRPPRNNCNALLSYVYTIMTITCASALECFGLDSYMGFLHSLRPGRASLACDLVEEFRASLCDSLVIQIINSKEITSKDFQMVSDSISLTDAGRKQLFKLIERDKERIIEFPLYDKSVPVKSLPYIQAQLLSQYIRGDINTYPPYIEG